MQAIIIVMLFPPKESFRYLVNKEFLYGMKELFFYNSLITNSKWKSETFIKFAYYNINPFSPCIAALSQPAKSTILYLLFII